jgi:undecaprenyl diphosphate synthase
MDGNGRWAINHGLKRTEGHKKGSQVLKNIVIHLAKSNIKYLSVFAFSSENWNRSPAEVKFLMNYSRDELSHLRNAFHKENVKIIWSGKKTRLYKSVLKELEMAEKQTKNNTGMVLNICLNYGSRQEIVDGINVILNDKKIKKVNIKTLNNYFYNDIPDVDLLIRTSGEQRISNFLLFQSAYAELFFTKTLWPDFNSKELDKILTDFDNRNRRFGKA